MKALAKVFTIVALIASDATLCHQAGAAPAVTWSYALTNGPSPDPTCSTDLVNTGQSTLSNVVSFSNVTYYGGSLSEVNDGAYGGFDDADLNPVEAATVTFTLNTATNPAGYDIAQIVSYAGYADGRRSYQNYDLAVHAVGSTTGTFAAVVSTGVKGHNTGAPEWTQVNVGDGTYAMTSGVDQIQFTFHPGYSPGGEQPGGYWSDFYHEIDVFGVATYVPRSGANVPPPAANVTPTWAYSLSAPSGDPTSSTDLVNRAQATLYPSVLFNGSTDYGTSPGALNDGSFGSAWDSGTSGTNEFAPVDGAVVTYSFSTATKRLGYDIKQIISFASYADGRRAKQKYDVAAHYVGTAVGTFVALSSVDNLGYFSGAPEWTRVNIGNGSSVIASGVDQIRFTFHNNNNGGFEVSIYREIDVLGSPTLPPVGTVIYIK